MYNEMTTGFSYYLGFYMQYASDFWAEMNPARYGILLIMILVFGWLLLKSGMKQ